MENENISEDAVTGEDGVTSPEGSTTVSDNIGLKELNEIYGTEFKTKEDALKSIKETKNFVGKRKEDFIAEAKQKILAEIGDRGIDTSNFVTKSELEKEKFYAGNPNLKGLETIIEAVKKDKNISYEEVLNLDELKPLLEPKGQTSEKSVLMTSPTSHRDEPSAYDIFIGQRNPQARLEALADIIEAQTKK